MSGSVATKLFRQIRSKAREIDRLLMQVDTHFPAKECSSQMLFNESLKRWLRAPKKPATSQPSSGEDLDAVLSMPVSDSVRELIGDEGESKEMDLSLGFEMIREMSRHLTGLQIVLEWCELVKQSLSADNITDHDIVGIERGAMLVDRVSLLLDEDEGNSELDFPEDVTAENQPLFGPEYQTEGLHPYDRATIDELDDIADEVKTRIRNRKEEGGHEPSQVEVLHEVNSVLFDQIGFFGAPSPEWFDSSRNQLRGVLKARRGSPIPLCILHAAVSTRVGLNVRGVRIPSYFLLRVAFGDVADEASADGESGGLRIDQKANSVDIGTREDIRKSAEIEVYWNGDDKWYPAEVDSIEGDVITVNYWDNDNRHRRLLMENMNKLPDLHKDTLVFRLLVDRASDVRELAVGRRVEVFWAQDNTWYTGTVKWVDTANGNVHVRYDDGDERNTTLSIGLFGAPPARHLREDENKASPPDDGGAERSANAEEGKNLVFRLFDRPFSDESDATSCFVDPHKSGKVLCHAETSSLLRENGIQSSKFRSHLSPVQNPAVWVSMLKHMLRMAGATERQEHKNMWSNQLVDLKKLEQYSPTSWAPPPVPSAVAAPTAVAAAATAETPSDETEPSAANEGDEGKGGNEGRP
mmetsp:Transcript_25056/g.40434  ORF Transcript_25056/g.40434 Transcript_25056/m.40434 type:complete len:638 (-) Transcript_25056:280-2193(-)